MCNINSLEAVQRPQWVFSIWGFHMWYIIFLLYVVLLLLMREVVRCILIATWVPSQKCPWDKKHTVRWIIMLRHDDSTYCTFFLTFNFLTFNFEVVSPETVRLKVEGQRGVGLVQEQVHPGQLNALPLKHRTQDLSGAHRGDNRAIVVHPHQNTKRHHVWQWEGNTWIPADSTDLRVFFFIAGTISVSMSTFRSNLRLKHSLLGSWRHSRTLSLHVDEGFSLYPPDPP